MGNVNIKEWNVEDDHFWESTGKKIANRDLWISIPSLLCGFAVWIMWGIITFLIALCGGRNVIAASTALLILRSPSATSA